MVVKKKVGKGRLDKYYYLAKEQGYRARSAFKLVQLNSKYHFLENARVLVDLCAAPGGWLQVASKYMPLSRVIIGIDLDSIKPIPGVKTFVCDITTEKCRSELKKELKTWKVDVFLNDGAPNVGSAWCKDAYNQAELSLMALKLATEFLVEGGTFVTKIFRSKDYNSLLWVFGQLFKKVESTKPASSRNVSAEIFVVCSGFLNPKKIDPRLLDPKSVFSELDADASSKALNILKPEKHQRQRQGYEDGVTLLYRTATLAEFCSSEDPMTFLGTFNAITFEDAASKELLETEPKMSASMQLNLADLKVLGKGEFKQLLKWRLKMRKATEKNAATEKQPDEEESEPLTLEEQADEMAKASIKASKKVKRKKLDKKNKERIRMQMGMSIKGDVHEMADEIELFKLKNIPTNDIVDENAEIDLEESESELESKNESEEEFTDDEEAHLKQVEAILEEDYNTHKATTNKRQRPKYKKLDEQDSASESEEEEDVSENPLLVKDSTPISGASSWFNRSEFQSEDESDSDNDKNIPRPLRHAQKKAKNNESSKEENQKLLSTISAMTSALMLRDQGKEELIDESFNKYAFPNEQDLPSWFVEEEAKHSIPQKPISKEAVNLIKERMKSIASRPMKKAHEYNMRLKMRSQRKLDSLKRKASTIAESEEMTDKQKLTSITKMLSKTQEKRKLPTLVVGRGFNKGVKGRPRGVKGKYKMVDPRMKKELRVKKKLSQEKKKKA
jgi:AdoMet-dependent rRNA methyltransferase SPB1